MSSLSPATRIKYWIKAAVVCRRILSAISSRLVHSHRVELKNLTNGGESHSGEMAPHFVLPRVGGGDCSLDDYRGRRVLLVFVEPGNACCQDVAPQLKRLQRSGKLNVLVVARGPRPKAALWADDVLATFPVLVDSGLDVSRQYDVLRVPCRFSIDEQGAMIGSG